MNLRQIDVVCVGQAVVDCITRGRKSFGEGDPQSRPVTIAESIHLATGGDAVNEAFVLTKLKARVSLVCGLGRDLAGDILFSEAKNRGVCTDHISRLDDLRTPIANLMVQEDGSRYSINSQATLLEGYIPSVKALENARIVSFASLFRAPLDRAETVRELIKAASAQGSIVCADTKLPTFRKMSLDDLKDVLPLVDYIFPNEKEAAWYTGEDRYEKMAEKLLSFGIKNVVIKTGPEGCFAASGTEMFTLPALPVKAVDTTGAGDNFVAGFLSALLEGASFRECAGAGIRQAAGSISHMGAC